MKIDIKSLVLGALLAIAIFVSVGAASDGPPAWEYKVVVGRVAGGATPLENVINNHVAQGWQFMSASGVGDSSGFAVMRREKADR
jgi:hypothetical protein